MMARTAQLAALALVICALAGQAYAAPVAVIRAPASAVPTASGGATPVFFDAAGSVGERFEWTLRQAGAAGGDAKIVATGRSATINLQPGAYTVTLVVSSGAQSAAAASKFTLGGSAVAAATTAMTKPSAVVSIPSKPAVIVVKPATAALPMPLPAAKPLPAAAAAVVRATERAEAPAPRYLAAYISSPPNYLPATRTYNTSVKLDGSLSSAPAGRKIVSYSWTIKQRPSGGGAFGVVPAKVMFTDNKPVSNAYLPSGYYDVTLVVTDSSKASQTANVVLTIGGGSEAGTTAAISLPLSYVAGKKGKDGKVPVFFSAYGSVPGKGRALPTFVWAVLSLADGKLVTNFKGASGTAPLSPGKYQVGLLVADDKGTKAISVKNVVVAA